MHATALTLFDVDLYQPRPARLVEATTLRPGDTVWFGSRQLPVTAVHRKTASCGGQYVRLDLAAPFATVAFRPFEMVWRS